MFSNSETATLEEIITEYVDAVMAYDPALLAGDSAGATAAYERVAVCSRELRRRGLDAQKALLPLLGHQIFRVRLCAATDALEFAPEIAEAELAKLASSNDLVGLDASTILREWREGRLKGT